MCGRTMLDDLDSSGWGSHSGPQDYQIAYNNPRANYSNSNFDVRHAFKGYAVYQLPFGRGKQFLNSNRLLDEAVGGWQVSGTVVLQTGNPVHRLRRIRTTTRRQVRSFRTGIPESIWNPSNHSINNWFNPAAFTATGEWNLRQREKEQPLWAGNQHFQFLCSQVVHDFRGGKASASSSAPMRKTSSIIPASAIRMAPALAVLLASANPTRAQAHITRLTVNGRNLQLGLRVSF